MCVMWRGCQEHTIGTKLFGKEPPSITPPGRHGIELREEVRVTDVDLVRVDPDDGPVLLVQLDHLEDVLAAQHDVVVELIPPRQRRETRAGDVRDGAPVQPPDGTVECV